jgi:hypothetical protein
MFLVVVSALAALAAVLALPSNPPCQAYPQPNCPAGRDGQSSPGSPGPPGANCDVVQFPNGRKGCYYREDGTVTEQNPDLFQWVQELQPGHLMQRIYGMIAMTILIMIGIHFRLFWTILPFLTFLYLYIIAGRV